MKNILAKIPKRKTKTVSIISGIAVFTLLAGGIIANYVYIDHEKKIPYYTLNGYAENEKDYDPGVTLLLDMNEELLSSIDAEFNLLGVWQKTGTSYMAGLSFDGYNEPQPETKSTFLVNSSLIFETEEEATAVLEFAFAYYVKNAYAVQGNEGDSDSLSEQAAQLEANNTSAYEQALKQYNAGPDIIVPSPPASHYKKVFSLALYSDVLDKLIGKPSVPPVRSDYTQEWMRLSNTKGFASGVVMVRNYNSSNASLPEDEYTYIVSLRTEIKDLELANLPKFEGNFKYNAEFKPEWAVGEKVQDALPCPLEPNSVAGGWLPEYGCSPAL